MLLVAVGLTGCGALPPLAGRQASTYLAETADTPLGRAVAAADTRDGRSGMRALTDPLEAFAARALLMRHAQRSLDLQYYIWHDDTTGLLLLDELRQAADRGVRVRLLLDDNGIGGLDAALSWLDAHPAIEVRLFNPYPQRRFKAMGYLTDFDRLNRRMHNKALIADTQATIVGGRNIGDTYFGADPRLAFADLDVLAAGPVTREVARSFDGYWNSEMAYPVHLLVPPPASEASRDWGQRVVALRAAAGTRAYLKGLTQTPLAAELAAGALALEWVPMALIADLPTKAAGAVDEADLLATQLAAALGRARHSIDLVSPYFVPGAEGTHALGRYPAAGVRVRIVTNSLAATDVAAVHAGYAGRREDLLRAGVQLYELKPDPDNRPATGWRLAGSSAASLHGKTFAVDRERAFVGSFNIDPRSVRLNTEMGLIIHSPQLASAIADTLDQTLPTRTYRLHLDPTHGLTWAEQTQAGALQHTTEPQASLWRRMLVAVLRWLPVAWML